MKFKDSTPLRQENCSPEGDFNGGLMHTVHRLYFLVQKRIEHILAKEKEISFSQFLILVGFSSSGCPFLTQARLAEELMLTEATVSRHIHILVGKQLLTREKDSHNKKSYNITLTKNGSKAFERAKRLVTNELDAIFLSVADKDKKNIIKVFSNIIISLQQKK